MIFNGLLGKKGCDFLEKKGEMAPRQARYRELGVDTSASLGVLKIHVNMLRLTSTYFDSAQNETLRTRRSLRDAQYETLNTGCSVRDARQENLGEGNYTRKRYGLTFGRIEHEFLIKF